MDIACTPCAKHRRSRSDLRTSEFVVRGSVRFVCEVGAVCLYRGAARVFLRVMCIYMSSSCNGVMILSNKENYSERMPLSAKQLCRVRTRCDLEIVNE